MRNKYKLSDDAKFDLLEVKSYYNKLSKSYTKILLKQLISSIKELQDYPEIGKESLFNSKEIQCGNYRIFYLFRDNKIFIFLSIINFLVLSLETDQIKGNNFKSSIES